MKTCGSPISNPLQMSHTAEVGDLDGGNVWRIAGSGLKVGFALGLDDGEIGAGMTGSWQAHRAVAAFLALSQASSVRSPPLPSSWASSHVMSMIPSKKIYASGSPITNPLQISHTATFGDPVGCEDGTPNAGSRVGDWDGLYDGDNDAGTIGSWQAQDVDAATWALAHAASESFPVFPSSWACTHVRYMLPLKMMYAWGSPISNPLQMSHTATIGSWQAQASEAAC